MYVVLSKLFWFFASPSSILTLLILAGMAMMGMTHRRRGLPLIALSAAGIAILWILPVGEWVLMPLEARFPQPRLPERIDGIVLADGFVSIRQTIHWHQVRLGSPGQLVAAAELAQRYPSARIVLTAGESTLSLTGHSEAEFAREVLISLGVCPSRIMWEPQARNKYENARASYDLAHPEPGETWVLVASAFQMPRVVGAYRRAGWTGVIAYPVDYQTPDFRLEPAFNLPVQMMRFDLAIREWLGLLIYWALDRSSELYPKA
jgi:uncharacterized SAM-binding protein YcdF (DUF218 family)